MGEIFASLIWFLTRWWSPHAHRVTVALPGDSMSVETQSARSSCRDADESSLNPSCMSHKRNAAGSGLRHFQGIVILPFTVRRPVGIDADTQVWSPLYYRNFKDQKADCAVSQFLRKCSRPMIRPGNTNQLAKSTTSLRMAEQIVSGLHAIDRYWHR
jgi:hypothetical protein